MKKKITLHTWKVTRKKWSTIFLVMIQHYILKIGSNKSSYLIKSDAFLLSYNIPVLSNSEYSSAIT